jgi:hypothetical protein
VQLVCLALLSFPSFLIQVMIASSFLTLGLAFSVGVQGLPLQKRIAQVISASTAQWEKACVCF